MKNLQITIGDVVEKLHIGLSELAKCDFPDFNVNWNISKNHNLCETVVKIFNKYRQSLQDKHIEKDPNTGNYLFHKISENESVVVWKSEKDKIDFEKSIRELLDTPLNKFEDTDFMELKNISLKVIKNYVENTIEYNKDKDEKLKKQILNGQTLNLISLIIIDDL
jgi:hypothetical protein